MRTKYEILNVLFRAEAKSKLIAVTQKLIQEGPVFRRSTMKVPSFFKFPHTSQIAQIPKKP